MRIKEVLAAINQMQCDGVIDRYAIGGAVGATFYLEPVATLDVDIFVALHPEPGRVIAGWPVQFLPPSGPLGEEALAGARETEVEGEPTRVFTAEHLAALALQTGRAKDKARLLQFIEAGALNPDHFQAILQRHGLLEKWRQFEQQFLQS